MLLAIAVAGVDISSLLSLALKAICLLFGTYAVPKLLPKLPELTQSLVDWLSNQASHVHNQYVAGVLQRLSTLVGQKVLAYENTEIEYLKSQAAAGQITPEQLPALLKKLKDDLLAELKTDASAHGLWELALEVFAGSESNLVSWLEGLVEAHVAALPPSGLQTAKSPDTAPAIKAPAPVTPPSTP